MYNVVLFVQAFKIAVGIVGMVKQVHCIWRRTLRRRLEFHVCTINKSAHTKILCILN